MRARAFVPLICACSLAAPAFAASATSLLYERALMAEAHRRCRLFSPFVASALDAGALQARGAARRAGQSAAALDAVEHRAAAKARTTPCASPDLQLAAGRVRSAYLGWSRLSRMSFPGDTAAWKAHRSRAEETAWRLHQTTRLGALPLAFGLAGEGSAPSRLLAVARFDRRPAFARLHAGRRVFIAESRDPAPRALRTAGPGEPLAFRFSPAAVEALAALDPRQSVRLEFVVPTAQGEAVRSSQIEVGDFAAAQAFLAAAR